MLQIMPADQQRIRDLGVATLYLFGSRAQGIAGPDSDYDFGVLFNDAAVANDTETYIKRYGELYDVCGEMLRNEPPPSEGAYRHLDIVFLQRDTMPLELRFHVVRYGCVLFDGNPKQRVRFEERTVAQYCDFRPMLDCFDHAILAAI